MFHVLVASRNKHGFVHAINTSEVDSRHCDQQQKQTNEQQNANATDPRRQQAIRNQLFMCDIQKDRNFARPSHLCDDDDDDEKHRLRGVFFFFCKNGRRLRGIPLVPNN